MADSAKAKQDDDLKRRVAGHVAENVKRARRVQPPDRESADRPIQNDPS